MSMLERRARMDEREKIRAAIAPALRRLRDFALCGWIPTEEMGLFKTIDAATKPPTKRKVKP
jgi:hypothetical protein